MGVSLFVIVDQVTCSVTCLATRPTRTPTRTCFLLLLRTPLLLLGRHRSHLQRVDAALSSQVLLQQVVDHTVAFELAQALELGRRDDETEVGLGGGAVGHGLVVFVEVGVVEDLEACGAEFAGYLDTSSAKVASDQRIIEGPTFSRIVFSTGPTAGWVELPESVIVPNRRLFQSGVVLVAKRSVRKDWDNME